VNDPRNQRGTVSSLDRVRSNTPTYDQVVGGLVASSLTEDLETGL